MKRSNTLTADYRVHDISVRFMTDNADIHEALSKVLECFSSPAGFREAHILISLLNDEERDRPFLPPENSQIVYKPENDHIYNLEALGVEKLDLYFCYDSSEYCMDLGDVGVLSYSLEKGTAHGHLMRLDRCDPEIFTRMVFMIVFWELFRAKGYFPVHCSAVERGGQGIIFPGFSGAGKTTACVALIRQGFGFLGDDRPIFRYREDGILEVLSFPEEIDVTDQTIDLFPELKGWDSFKIDRNFRKKSFRAQDVYPGSVKEACIPKVILYPEISGGGRSRVEKIPKGEALTRFMPHSLVVINKESASRHFDIISDLIESAECYKLTFGSDFESLGKIVESLL